MESSNANYVSFISNDNALIVDFLTSIAATLNDHQLLSSKDVDNLRLVISSCQTSETLQKQSLILSLCEQNADFVHTLRALFGDVALGTNLFRHSLRSYLSVVNEAVASLGHDLLTRSQSLFNRSFHTYVHDRCEYRGLFSSTLVDLSQILSQSVHALTSVQERCTIMAATGLDFVPDSQTAQPINLDECLAKSLGFTSSQRLSLPYASERTALALIGLALTEIADGCEVFADSLRRNNSKGVSPQLDLICDELRLEAAKLRDSRFFRGDDLTAWEVRRLSIALALSKFRDLVTSLRKSLGTAISLDLLPTRFDSEDSHRRIAFLLISAGAKPSLAMEAARKLTAYCKVHSIAPREILPAELSKIHECLTESSLKLLQDMAEDASMNLSATAEKRQNLGRSSGLIQTFLSRMGNAAAPLVIFGFLLSSLACGFKTDPKSEIMDLRPDVPFRIPKEVTAPPKSISPKDLKGKK